MTFKGYPIARPGAVLERAVVLLLGLITLLAGLALLAGLGLFTLFIFLASADDFRLGDSASFALDRLRNCGGLFDNGARRGKHCDRRFRIVENFDAFRNL